MRQSLTLGKQRLLVLLYTKSRGESLIVRDVVERSSINASDDSNDRETEIVLPGCGSLDFVSRLVNLDFWTLKYAMFVKQKKLHLTYIVPS